MGIGAMSERRIWTRTVPGMEAFDDWQPIETAPIDGSKFMGANEKTGNVYTTWYQPMWGSLKEVEEADISKAIVWWCEDDRDGTMSFIPTHWRRIDA